MSSKNTKSELLSLFKKVRKGKNPKAKADIEAIVVLSGESGDPASPTSLSDTEERVRFGIKIVKRIQKRGGEPTLILSGTKSQNNLLSEIAKKQGVRKISQFKNPPVPYASTLSQFQAMKKISFKKIAFITHAYHGVRTHKYAEKHLPKNTQFQLFLFDRKKMRREQINDEIEKIFKYSQKGDI